MRGRLERGLAGGCGGPWHGCARGSSRRRRRSPRRSAAPAARARLTPPTACASISAVLGGKNSNETRGGPASKSTTGSAASRPRVQRRAEVCAHQRSPLEQHGRRSSPPRRPAPSPRPGDAAVQIATVSGSPGSGAAAPARARRRRHQSATSASAKPSRRWACSSRRNSSACGAKSTITSMPPGRNTRAASAIAAAGSIGIMQHLMDHHRVEGGVRQRQLIHVAAADQPVCAARRARD